MRLNEPSDIWRYRGNWKVNLYKPYIKERWIEKLNEMIRSTPLSNFGVRQMFEEKLASYCKCDYSLATNSGTSAIIIGLLALGFKAGDRLIGPNYGNIAWGNACNFLGIEVISLDIRSNNFCLDEHIVDIYLESHPGKIKGVCYINQAGYNESQVKDMSDICKKHNVFMLEDSCNAMGQWYNGVHAGTTGDIGFISFGVPKLLTCGEGGGLLIKNKDLYDKCNDIAYQGGWYKPPAHTVLNLGINFIMPAHNAHFLSAQLDDIDELLEMRKVVCNKYLSAGIEIKKFNQPPSIYQYYAKNPLKIILMGDHFNTQLLFKAYIPFGHLFGCYEETPISNDVSNHIITLPNSLDLNDESINLVVAAIKMGER